MKICPQCSKQLDDNVGFCTQCGYQFAPVQQQQQQPQQQPPVYQVPAGTPPMGVPAGGYAPVYDPYDHTAEFDPKDISDNKVISMLVYLMGAIGIVIALLASNSSPYVAFHLRQALKFTVVEILATLCVLLLCWTVIVPIAYGIFTLVLLVIKFICFFQICEGKAKEPAIIRSLNFLK
jgi:uncharacterized membrane protein